MKSQLTTIADVFGRLDEAYACWEEDMWGRRLLRHLYKCNTPSRNFNVAEVDFPVDKAHKTKQLILESITRGGLDHLLSAFRNKGFTRQPRVTLEDCSKLNDAGTPYKELSDEFLVSTAWDTYHFPYYLGKWNMSSRRIYYLSNDLMLLLSSTSLKGLTFRDVQLPFPSFAIALETPLVTEQGKELDFFLLGEHSAETLAVYAFATSLSQRKNVDSVLRSKIDEAMQKGNMRRFMQLAKKELIHPTFFNHVEMMIDEGWQDYLDADLEEEFSKVYNDDWMVKFFRVLFGLSVYLKTLSTQAYEENVQVDRVKKKVYAGAKDGAALVSTAEVFKVQSVIELTREETVNFRNQLSGHSDRQMSVHFREGHWRRMPGQGHSPTALKTVWVRPTIVRRDRLPDNALPFGSAKVL